MKILIVNTNPMIQDGIFSAIMNYAENMDWQDMEIDFVAINLNVDDAIRQRICLLNANLYILQDRNTNTFKYIYDLSKLIRMNKYSLVHAHGSSCTLATELFACALAGVPCCPHSHNTSCQHKKAHQILKPLFRILYRNGFACSEQAGKWLYGNRDFVVMNNGIDLEKYIYCKENRERYRKKYNLLEFETVILHIAHFTTVKNHKFLLEVYKDLLKKDSSYRLLLVGKGETEAFIRKYVKENQIEDKVVFIGITQNVPELLSASDIFVLPSLYEGFPFTTVEAQVSGIKSYVSNNVTEKSRLTNTINFLPLEKQIWIDMILQKSDLDRELESRQAKEKICCAGYDIKRNAQELKMYYEKYGKR